ncbi:FAD-binding protein [Micromonospora sp. LAH09]|uniref:FAD-binding oxidoreductase n=1 Tax=Micromonospora cabrerizensis TaxID=2911213 RepID=UPI001EE9AA32|nr:FAD-binding protein [Micromonospora cabrerizensis]MCG5468123.1 FAD-binding protein [Micromonospora cabrerizensis]
MNPPSRRDLLRAGAVTSAAVLCPSPAAASPPPPADCAPPLGPVRVLPDDPRYADLVRRGNRRFVGRPDEVRVVGSTDQVVSAVQDAVRTGRRVAVRGGGHCFEGFVDDPAVRMVIDLSGLTEVYHDPRGHGFAVEAGATLGEAYRRLFFGWGVTLPGGSCPGVGVGGHVAGGGYGRLSRVHGLVVDHLYAVEVVVVDRGGTARAVVATREPTDPHRDLWWAHTGGGGGNFGVVTRYWFRSLPTPPARLLDFTVTWPWAGMDERGFHRLAGNFGRWCARHSGPDSRARHLYAELILSRPQAGGHTLSGQVPHGSRHLFDELLVALGDGLDVTPTVSAQTLPWLAATLGGENDDGKGWRLKVKSAFHRAALSDRQLHAAYRHLTRTDTDLPAGSVSLNTYGGAINAVPPAATAATHRSASMVLFYLAGWADPAADSRHLAWIREFYRDMYADTGGIPPDGAYVNYPDVDLRTASRPWSELYYGPNYPRLQQVKARWDPRDVFHHDLSVRPPGR